MANPELLPKGILFWRSFTHWLGGMGVLVLTIALLPMLGIGGQKIMRAETTGPTMDKISFTTNETAKKLYIIYGGMTLLEIILLYLTGIGLFDACCNTFGNVSTGVMKSKVVDFINHLKDEGIVDNFEPLNEYKGFSIRIDDINKHHAFFEYIKHNLISGADWAMMGKDFVLFYAFESR